jgi:hypothetical protein
MIGHSKLDIGDPPFSASDTRTDRATAYIERIHLLRIRHEDAI